MTMQSEIDKLFDENNNDNIVLYDENDKPMEFAQIAVIPLDEDLYVILKPVGKIEGVADDEAIVFVLKEDDNEEEYLAVCDDFKIVDQVFEEYYKLVEEQDN